MSNRLCCPEFGLSTRRQLVLAVLMLVIGLTLAGCGGGGGGDAGVGANITPSPEDAVRGLLAAWETNGLGPVFGMAASGQPEASFASSTRLGEITLTDLSGKSWQLQVNQVEYLTSSLANITTTYFFESLELGRMIIVFQMGYDNKENKWLLNDITAQTLPGVMQIETGIQGYVTDRIAGSPVASAAAVLWNQAMDTVVQSTATNERGFYRMLGLTPGTYVLVISKDGYVLYTQPGVVVN